jgi:hypothetical protein
MSRKVGGRIFRAGPPDSDGFDSLPPASLELLERQLIAALTAVWRAQGVKKKIIQIESNGYIDKGMMNDE